MSWVDYLVAFCSVVVLLEVAIVTVLPLIKRRGSAGEYAVVMLLTVPFFVLVGRCLGWW